MDKRLILVIIWMLVIFVGSTIPGQDLQGISTPDYILHGLEYAVLGGLLGWWCFHRRSAVDPSPLGCAALSTVIGSIYGITDELHQGFVPGRCQDPRDWAADMAGALIGATMILIVLFHLKRKHEQKRRGNP